MKEEILDNHRSVWVLLEFQPKMKKLDLWSLYWIRKLHKCPYKQHYIAGSAKCSTKPLSKLLTYILDCLYHLSWNNQKKTIFKQSMQGFLEVVMGIISRNNNIFVQNKGQGFSNIRIFEYRLCRVSLIIMYCI